MRKALIIRGGAIGDFILTLPIFEALRSRWPQVDIEVLGYSHVAALAVGRRHASSVRNVGDAAWAPLFSAGGDLTDSQRRWLAGFDTLISVWPDAGGVIADNLRSSGGRAVVSVNPMPPAGNTLHVVEFMARQCAGAGLPDGHPEPHLYPSERDRWWAERFMRVSRAGEQPLLGLAPGSGSPRKNWPASKYADLARYWVSRRGGNVLMLAGPADEDAARAFTAAMDGTPFVSLEGEDLPRVAAALERCEIYVGNDSGPTHMAAAVRTPTVALFGPTDPAVWAPRAPRVRVVATEDRLAELSVDEVIAQVEAAPRS